MYWNARGYHAFPLTEQDRLDLGAEAGAWQAYAQLLERAKQGNFAEVRRLIEWHDSSNNWVLGRAYLKLLGDAGKAADLRDLLVNVLPNDPVHYRYSFCETLGNWGSLSVVPTLVDLYALSPKSQDAPYIPPRISRLLEAEPGPVSKYPVEGADAEVAAYVQFVTAHYEILKSALGGDDAVVFRGEKLSVAAVARRGLDDLGKDRFDEEMRHKFEAMTGIDCSSFYRDGELQPLAAAALLEEFLEGPEPAKYEEGVRYFFGRAIDPPVTDARRPARP
jgi:hypothetical protein